MDKVELVNITIERLLATFKTSPESFEFHHGPVTPYGNMVDPTIVWQPQIQLSDSAATIIPDPNNQHAVVVVYNNRAQEITCLIYLKAPLNVIAAPLNNSKSDCVVSLCRWFEQWRAPCRNFNKLRKLIMERDKRKENLKYLQKLSSVFPDALDHHLLD